MERYMPFVVFGGVAAAIVAAIVIASFFERKRTAALQALAARLNFAFTPKGGRDEVAALARFQLFSSGHSRRMSNVLHGAANAIDVTICDYRYTTGSGKQSHTWNQTVLLFRSPRLTLPSFALRPENIFHRIGAAFGYRDINFDTHPAFSKRYLLRGEDEPAVRTLFTDALIAFYEARKDLCTEGAGNTLVFYRGSKRVKPEEAEAFLREGFELFTAVRAALAGA